MGLIIKSQRKNYYLILNKIKNIKGLRERHVPKNSFISADALIIIVKNKNLAKRCRKFLLQSNISTKILPEAYSWHFAGRWSHMKEFNNKKNFKNSLKISENILSKAVSIPIFVKMTNKQILAIKNSLFKALK